MTIKIIKRNTCPKSWAIGKQVIIGGEILELVDIDGDKYTWIDVAQTHEAMRAENETK